MVYLDQIVSSIRQVKQNISNINSTISQLEQDFSREHSQLSNITQQLQSHLNDIHQLSNWFGQSFQQLENCERMASSGATQQFATGGQQYGTSSYNRTSPSLNYGVSGTNYNSSQTMGNNSGYQKQFHPSQTASTTSMNTRDQDVGQAYYNSKPASGSAYNSNYAGNTTTQLSNVNTTGQMGNNSGYQRQFHPSQNAATMSMNTRDQDVGQAYYNSKPATGSNYNNTASSGYQSSYLDTNQQYGARQNLSNQMKY